MAVAPNNSVGARVHKGVPGGRLHHNAKGMYRNPQCTRNVHACTP